MKRYLELDSDIYIRNYDNGEWSFNININENSLAKILCEFLMLNTECAKSLTLSNKDKNIVVSISSKCSRITSCDNGKYKLNLSVNDFDIIFYYFLHWYRDGMAEVPHVDVDLESDSTHGENCTLVLTANKYKALKTQEETIHILNDQK